MIDLRIVVLLITIAHCNIYTNKVVFGFFWFILYVLTLAINDIYTSYVEFNTG